MSAHIRTHPVYYNKPKFYWELLIYKQQQRCHLRYISLHKGKKGGANTMCNQIILLVSSGMASCQWLHVSPRGQSWKTELQKNILRACEGRSPITVLEKKKITCRWALRVAELWPWQGRAQWLHTPLEEIITLAGCLLLVSVHHSLLSLRSPFGCVCETVCVHVCVSLQASYCFAAFDAVIQIQIKKKRH